MRSAALPSTRESDIRRTIGPSLLIRELSSRAVLRTAVAFLISPCLLFGSLLEPITLRVGKVVMLECGDVGLIGRLKVKKASGRQSEFCRKTLFSAEHIVGSGAWTKVKQRAAG
jgi:hypothetical protein